MKYLVGHFVSLLACACSWRVARYVVPAADIIFTGCSTVPCILTILINRSKEASILLLRLMPSAVATLWHTRIRHLSSVSVRNTQRTIYVCRHWQGRDSVTNTKARQRAADGHLNCSSNTRTVLQYSVATLLADKLFTNYNLSIWCVVDRAS